MVLHANSVYKHMCRHNREECEKPRNRSKVRFNPFSTYIYTCKIAYDVPTLRHSHTSWLIPSLFLLRASAWFSLMAWCLKEVAVRLTRKDNKTTHRRGDNLTSMSDLLCLRRGLVITSKICAKILMSTYLLLLYIICNVMLCHLRFSLSSAAKITSRKKEESVKCWEQREREAGWAEEMRQRYDVKQSLVEGC